MVFPSICTENFSLLTELQRNEPWENIPLELHWLAVRSVKVSVIFA